MHQTHLGPLQVRHDLDLLEVMKLGDLTLEGYRDPKRLLRRFGGHLLRTEGFDHWPEQLRKDLRPGAQRICHDYEVCKWSNNKPGGFAYDQTPVAKTSEGVVVTTEESWNCRNVLAWMWDNCLRPASVYEHLAIVSRFQSVLEGRTAIPFGGYTNPKRLECTGLLLANRMDLWFSEGGASYWRGEAKRATKVCFTAIAVAA